MSELIYQQLSDDTYLHRPQHFYRGKCMKRADFQKLKNYSGDLICFYSFLSTSTKEDVALMFASKELHTDDEVSVVFHIRINELNNEKQRSYAFIRHLSAVPDE